MKQYLKILFAIAIIFCGLNSNCQADTLDNYQIYIGKRIILTESSFNSLSSTLPSLKLDSSNYFETININFSHCSPSESGRQLKLTDTDDKTIMIWKFVDKRQKSIMSIPINEILTHEAIRSNSSFKLYYFDEEHPVWQLLTSVFVGQLDIEEKEKQSSLNKFDKITVLYIIATLVLVFLVFIVVRQRSPNR